MSTTTVETASNATFTFDAEDGLKLHVHGWRPRGEARAVVQIVHGMSEHGGRYAELAGYLVERGYAVYANDHRGHGRSLAPGQPLGHMGDSRSFERATRDVAALCEHLGRQHPGKKRVLIGHSMGSFYVQRLLYTRPRLVHAALLSASNGKPPPIALAGRGLARVERLRLGKRGQSALLNALSFEDFNKRFKPNRTPFDWISRDEEEVDRYIADPLCGQLASIQTWIDLLDALPQLTEPENVGLVEKDLPIYLFAGSQDPVGDMGKGVERLEQSYRDAGLTRVELRVYQGARHETLHELNKDEVMADLAAWLEGALR